MYHTRLLHLAVRLYCINAQKSKCLILFYHRFCTATDELNLLPRLDINEFDRQLKHLARLYHVITLDEAVENIKTGKAFQRPSIVVTIDDGYKDNYALAYPVLVKHDVKATIYLTSGIIGTLEGLWLDDLEFALIHTKVKSVKLPEIFENEIICISTQGEKQKILSRLYRRLLPATNHDRRQCTSQVLAALGISPADMALRERVMLTWDEVREMASSGIHFEAHTLTHPFLPILPIEEAQREIYNSRSKIQDEIGITVKHFAIPNGTRSDFTERLRTYCRDNGFDSVVTTDGGTVDVGDDVYQLRRVLPPPPMYYFAGEIAKYLLLGR